MKKILLFSLISLFLIPIHDASAVEKSCPKTKLNQIINNKICKKNNGNYRWIDIVKSNTSTLPNIFIDNTNNTKVLTNDISYYQIAYNNMKPLLNNNVSNIKMNIIISDNAKKRNYQKYLESLDIAIKIWSPVFNNQDFNVILFTEKDSEWIDQKQSELMGKYLSIPEKQLQSYRIKQSGCLIAGFYLPNIILTCISENNSTTSASMLAHEYTHLVGMTSKELSNAPIGDSSRLRPCWIEEGIGTFYGMFNEYLLISEYKNNRLTFLSNLKLTIDKQSKNSIINTFYDLEQNMNTCSKVQDAYFLGTIAFEELSYKYGHNKIIEFNKMFYSGTNWKDAFNKTFGLSVESFYDTISNNVLNNIWNK